MYNEELEKALLYFIIFENEEFTLNKKDFYLPINQEIIGAINDIKANNEAVGLISITDKIKLFERNTVLEYLANLHEYIIGTIPQDAYKKIKELSVRRRTLELIKLRESKIENEENTEIENQKLIDELNKLEEENEDESFTQQLANTLELIENNVNKQNDTSLYTGIMELDKILLGLHNQELTIIGARPGVGKTTFALQIAQHLAKRGKNVGIVSLEMSETQLITKLVANTTMINSYKMRAGTLTVDELAKIGRTVGELNNLPLNIITKIRKIQDLEIKTRKLKNKKKLDVLIIDYLQLITSSKKTNSREQEVADISRTLKLMSLELDIPIIALCQLNRNASNSEPNLNDLRESGSVEQDADNVLFLYMEEDQKELSAPIVTIKIAKQRAGAIGRVKVRFIKSASKFSDIIM